MVMASLFKTIYKLETEHLKKTPVELVFSPVAGLTRLLGVRSAPPQPRRSGVRPPCLETGGRRGEAAQLWDCR